jgi:hypothetical protein
LALFGRRPPQGVEGFVIPASKNLHNNGLTHCSETATFSFVTSCLENYRARETYDKRILNHPRARFADTAHERKVGGP